MALDLYSSEYFQKKQQERIAKMTPQDFEPWDSARERYIAKKIEPLLQTYRQSDHDWFSDFSRRRGESTHSSDLIFKLQRLNPHISVHSQVNFPEDWGLYSSARGRLQFLTGMPRGWMTEWSYAIVDDRNLPTEERRGWRTVLVYLLMKGALTWEETLQEFGDPNDSWNDYRWQEVTADFRHGGDAIFERNIANAME